MSTTLLMAYLGIALMVGLAGIGSCYGLSSCGITAIGAMRKDPSKMGQYIGLSALPSSQGLYGFVGWYFASQHIAADMSVLAATAILLCGLLLGSVGLLSAMKQGKVLAHGIAATADGHNVFAISMVEAVFPELYAILALLVTLLTMFSL